ncbi:hypothetical protein QTP88_005092 [Uroleucon formosanum]
MYRQQYSNLLENQVTFCLMSYLAPIRSTINCDLLMLIRLLLYALYYVITMIVFNSPQCRSTIGLVNHLMLDKISFYIFKFKKYLFTDGFIWQETFTLPAINFIVVYLFIQITLSNVLLPQKQRKFWENGIQSINLFFYNYGLLFLNHQQTTVENNSQQQNCKKENDYYFKLSLCCAVCVCVSIFVMAYPHGHTALSKYYFNPTLGARLTDVTHAVLRNCYINLFIVLGDKCPPRDFLCNKIFGISQFNKSNNKRLRLERTLDENIIQNWFDDFSSDEESFGEDSNSDEDIVLRSDHDTNSEEEAIDSEIDEVRENADNFYIGKDEKTKWCKIKPPVKHKTLANANHTENIKIKRIDFLQDLSWELIKPQIQFRSTIETLPIELRRRAKILLGEKDTVAIETERPEGGVVSYLSIDLVCKYFFFLIFKWLMRHNKYIAIMAEKKQPKINFFFQNFCRVHHRHIYLLQKLIHQICHQPRHYPHQIRSQSLL